MTRIVPSVGVVVGTLMYLSPLKAVMDMRKNGRIGVSTVCAAGLKWAVHLQRTDCIQSRSP